MKNLRFMLLFLVILVLIAVYVFGVDYFKIKSFEEKRQDTVSGLEEALADVIQSGDYACCIEPPCKMCFLGNWIWEDGRCDCDAEIAQENWDNVCPECKQAIEEGECSSSTTLGTCPID